MQRHPSKRMAPTFSNSQENTNPNPQNGTKGRGASVTPIMALRTSIKRQAPTSYIFAEDPRSSDPATYLYDIKTSDHTYHDRDQHKESLDVRTDKQQRSSRNRSANPKNETRGAQAIIKSQYSEFDGDELWRNFDDALENEQSENHDFNERGICIRENDDGNEYWLLAEFNMDCPAFELDIKARKTTLKTPRALMAWSIGLLNTSPTARQLIKEAAKDGWSITLGNCGGYDFHMDVNDRRITLDDNNLSAASIGRSDYFRHALLFSLVRALRDIWQERRHAGFDTEYGPESILMLERVRGADCDLMAILAGWELRSENYGGFWRYLIGSEEGDIAMAYSAALERDPSSAFNGQALSYAFDQWFESDERINACDHETLEYFDTLTQESNEKPVFGSKILRAIGVEILSCQPDRTAYLRGKGREILSNPLYAGLNDPINQIHMNQIMYDLNVTRVQNVPFRDTALADKIFPGGKFTNEI